MKRKHWLLVLLPVVLLLVGYYNVSFFSGRSLRTQASVTQASMSEESQALAGTQVANDTAFAEPAGAPSLSPAFPTDKPSLSREELINRARKPVFFEQTIVLSKFPAWPKRSPFEPQRSPVHAPMQGGSTRLGSVQPLPTNLSAKSQPDPQVSAILVQGARRLAVVNGNLKEEGSRLGSWKILSIERDCIQVETPTGPKQIGLSARIAKVKDESRNAKPPERTR